MSNNDIQTTWYDLQIQNNSAGKGFVLVHISDLHNKSFGKKQERLLSNIVRCRPDIICITGDIVDGKKFQNAEAFIKRVVEIAPVFYVTGNHEYMAGNFTELEHILIKYGVNIIRNASQAIVIGQVTLNIYGIDDPYKYKYDNEYEGYIKEILDGSFTFDESKINILLSHRPELFELYDHYKFDIVLCGHAHGGQFRIFSSKGVIAPNQGLFPKYYQGIHKGNQITEIISRGLGNSVIPIRLNNKPEIVALRIKRG